MNVDSIREYCLALPLTTEKLQWGDVLCFKVNSKMFTVVGLDDSTVCFKCDPETFAELIEQEGIRPAPYLGRYKWILLERMDVLDDFTLRNLIENSYAMVSAKAKKKTKRHPRKSKARGRRTPSA